MIHAVVFDTDAPFLRDGAAPSPIPASERLVGLSLLRRAILMAWKAGAAAVTVVARDAEEARVWAASEVNLRVPVAVVTPEAPLPELEAEDWLLVLSAQVLPERGFVESLITAARESGVSVAAAGTGQLLCGPAVLSGGDLPAPARAQALRTLLASTETVQLAKTYWRLDSPAALKQADRDLYRGLTSITDGYLARVFYRYGSAWFTRRIINLPVTPNHVTWLHFALGLTGAGLLWQGVYWQSLLGALLIQVSVVLDCSDGEVARLKYQFSKFGGWLDVWADNLINIAVFAAVANASAKKLGVPLALTLGALAVAGVLMCILVIFSLAKLQSRRQPGEASSLAVTNRLSSNDQAASGNRSTLVDAIINEATSRDFLVLIVLFALLGRLEWMTWLAAIGSHVFWITFAVIQLSMLRTPKTANH